MRRSLISFLTCALLVLSFANTASALSFPSFSWTGFTQSAASPETEALYNQLEEEIVPQIANVLTPAQRQQFETAIENGASLRKAFKSLALNPEQKLQLGTTFGSLLKKDIFATMTPEQKKQLFIKKKELFIPTPQEIAEKVSEKLQFVQDKLESELNVEQIEEQVGKGIKLLEDKFGK